MGPISFQSLYRPPEMLGKTFSQIETVQRSPCESKPFLFFIQRHPSAMSSGTEDAITEKLLGDKVREPKLLKNSKIFRDIEKLVIEAI